VLKTSPFLYGTKTWIVNDHCYINSHECAYEIAFPSLPHHRHLLTDAVTSQSNNKHGASGIQLCYINTHRILRLENRPESAMCSLPALCVYCDGNFPSCVYLNPIFPQVALTKSFAAQFQDPSLRRFNLIALDLRGHGETGGLAGPEYDQEDSANDVLKFMVGLNFTEVRHLIYA
jgi:hypothetical protein